MLSMCRRFTNTQVLCSKTPRLRISIRGLDKRLFYVDRIGVTVGQLSMQSQSMYIYTKI